MKINGLHISYKTLFGTLSFFVISVISYLLPTTSVSAANCSNLGFNVSSLRAVDIPEIEPGVFDVTALAAAGERSDKVIAKFDVSNVTGNCSSWGSEPVVGYYVSDFSYGGYFRIGPYDYGMPTIPLLDIPRSGGIPTLRANDNTRSFFIMGGTYSRIPLGRTQIPLSSLTNNFSIIKSMENTFNSNQTAETANVVNNMAPTITIQKSAFCSGEVRDITIGDVLASSIFSGSVGTTYSWFTLRCNIQPKVSVKVSSPRGSHDVGRGIIKSENTTVGYELKWDNAAFTSSIPSPIILDTWHTQIRTISNSPENMQYTFTVKPVALVTNEIDIQSGPASSAIQFDITFT